LENGSSLEKLPLKDLIAALWTTLLSKTLISNVEKVYTYTGEVNSQGDANIALGDSIAYLKNFKQVENKIDFRFEYGTNLGMFCAREDQPYPHKHLPHEIKGEKVKS
jgi:hypothetical protein